jgi:hypothetical protein
VNNLLNSAKQRPERGQQVSTNPSVPAWLPSDIARRIDSAELADIPESASRELEVEADALGVYLAAVSAGALYIERAYAVVRMH